MSIVACYLAMPWRCNLLLGPSQQIDDVVVPPTRPNPVKPTEPYAPKTRETTSPRQTLASPRPTVNPVSLPEAVIVRALDLGRGAFVRCFRKASFNDPSVTSYKVRIHLELDATGVATSATSDAEDSELAECLVRVGLRLPFPAPGQRAVVDLPLFYRPE